MCKDSDNSLIEALAFQCVNRDMMIVQAEEILNAYSLRITDEEESASPEELLNMLYDAIIRENSIDTD